MQKYHRTVIRTSGSSQGSLLPNGDRIDNGRMAADFTHRVPAVGCYAVSETLSSVAHGDDALGVAVPGYVVYSARDDVVIACPLQSVIVDQNFDVLRQTFRIDAFDCIPDLDCAGDIS
jgi:hypothetical protein